jgi:8-hydroxy-5-deazaflavin:NADPH oxidoreductase
MKIGIIGSGIVGQTLGSALADRGEDVALGTRSPDRLGDKRGWGKSLDDWLRGVEHRARIVSFPDAAAHGEVVINATPGTVSLEALALCGTGNLRGKILIDVANPLDFSAGMPPVLTVSNRDSLGEQIQRAFPDVKVVKALNTVTAQLMVNPAQVAGGEHDLFICGDDERARKEVAQLLEQWFGWRNVIDLGDITNARGTEMLLPLWVRLYSMLGTPMFNFRVVR